MFRSIYSKVIIIVIFALALGYYDLPNQYQNLPGTPDSVKGAKVHLGLDLQGGSQLDYKVDVSKIAQKDQKAIVEGVKTVIEKRVNGLGVSEPNIYTSTVGDEQHLIVELAGVKDLDEAKKVVGKTIQLEFKEKRATEDKEHKANVKKLAQADLQKILNKKGSFETIGQEESQATPESVMYKENEWQFGSEISDKKMAAAILKGQKGEVIPQVLEGSDGYTVKDGQVVPMSGDFIFKVNDFRDTSTLPADQKAVMVSHILVAYRGADRAADSVTRTKDEAKTEAEALLQKLKSGGNFEQIAKASSDEPGAKDSAGKLTGSVKQGGSYDKNFTAAALQLSKKGEFSAVVESSFGFHIIRADDFNQIKYSQIFFDTADDPWISTGLTGAQFSHADVTFDKFLQPIIAIKFNDDGAKLFEEITGRNINKPIAIFVGGSLISAPNVNSKISGGSATITGHFTVEEAQALARDLNTGAIPAPVILSGQYTIGASLGASALSQSLKAGMIGIAILALFMILYYRLPGFVAVLALAVYSTILLFLIKSELSVALSLAIAVIIFIAIVYTILRSREGNWEKFVTFVLACFVLFFVTFLLSNPIVLTLAGVAGVILSIGMAVDANILIFERTKEELRAGRPLNSAIEVGFDRAWSSIRDSNFSSLITCAILFYFGTSIIQGFAFNLAAGILISMFSAITITKTLLMFMMKTKLGNVMWLWGVPKQHMATAAGTSTGINQTSQVMPSGAHISSTKKLYHIVEKSKIWFSLSGAVLAVSLVALVVFGLKLGIDFNGGTLLDLTFSKAVTVEQIKGELTNIQQTLNKSVPAGSTSNPASGTTALESAQSPVILDDARVVPSASNQFIITLRHVDNETHETILKDLQTKFGAVTENRFTTIGPVVGETLKQRALLAILLAMTAIILYIAFAFRKVPQRVSPWKFGLCAIVALLHDVLIPIGVFAVFRFEVDALFITAVLTVLGFSVHDTIVVFDRIRENLKYQERDETFAHVANKSMTQTMARSINTSFTAFITLCSLLVFGTPSIFNFILVLVIGIVVGTYSSIFIASPLLVLWQKKGSHQ